LAVLLDGMMLALEYEVDTGGLNAHLDIGEPAVTPEDTTMEATSSLTLFDAQGVLADGSSVLTVDRSDGSGNVVIELTEESVVRTLDLGLWVDGEVLHGWGTLTIDDGATPVTLAGGWTYAAPSGLEEDPDSDPAFVDEFPNMFHVGSGGGRAGLLGAILGFIGNVVVMAVNYVVDVFTPYTPPNSCDGPLIYDNSGQTCDGVNIACKNNLDDMCLSIDDIRDVTDCFKQCMKGRCGCGGSSHSRAKVSCDDSDSCGSCGSATGCSLAGSGIWYCDPTTDECICVKTIFHEMGHGCGALDQNGESFRIANWFKSECSNAAY
jgi:hypothetical protein